MAEATKAATGEAPAATGAVEKKAESSAASAPEIPEHLKEFIEKAIQSATDKVRTKYVKEKESLAKELDDAKMAKMSDEEKHRFELEKARKEIEDERKQLTLAKLESFATKALSDAGYGADAVALVMADSEEAVSSRIKALNTIISAREKLASERILKTAGTTVQQTFPGAAGALTIDQLKRMTPTQMDELMSTPEGRARAEAAFRK